MTPEARHIDTAIAALGIKDGSVDALLTESEVRLLLKTAFRAGRVAEHAELQPYLKKVRPKPPPGAYRRR